MAHGPPQGPRAIARKRHISPGPRTYTNCTVSPSYRLDGLLIAGCPRTALMPQSWRIGNALCHDGPMEPEEADVAIRLSAREYASGSDRPPVIWSALNSHLTDLCRDEPLDGDFLRLFQALEHWEQSVSPERER